MHRSISFHSIAVKKQKPRPQKRDEVKIRVTTLVTAETVTHLN